MKLSIKIKAFLFSILFLSSFVFSEAAKTVPVKGYYKKDGTYVAPHTRSAPIKKGTTPSNTTKTYTTGTQSPPENKQPTASEKENENKEDMKDTESKKDVANDKKETTGNGTAEVPKQ